MTLELKARWVKEGHKTPQPDWSTFGGAVSREIIRINLTYAALDDLLWFDAEIQNTYLQAPSSGKHYIICGPKLGLDNEGKIAIIVWVLYGGKYAGSDYCCHVRFDIADTNSESCKSELDMWMRPRTRSNRIIYFQLVLLYTDNILSIKEDP